jgi:aryl-alcohol dehydrogenase-like predicted oxidoreductase
VLPQLLDAGVNHIDVAASYGEAEVALAAWMPEHRDAFFLASKTGERTGSAARAELERSLERLGVDQIDLLQLHNLVEEDEWDQAFAPGGVVEALDAARAEGLIRFIGVTGHGLRIPGMHLRSLAAFDFDSVLFPYNHSLLANPAYAADVEALLTVCGERDVAAQTIKSIARRRWAPEVDRRFSWYEPLDDNDAISRAIRFVLSDDRVFLNTSSDTRMLPAILGAAQRDLLRPTEDEMTADALAFGITPIFDGGALERI